MFFRLQKANSTNLCFGDTQKMVILHLGRGWICGVWECICKFCQKGAWVAKQGYRSCHVRVRKVIPGAQGGTMSRVCFTELCLVCSGQRLQTENLQALLGQMCLLAPTQCLSHLKSVDI